MVSQRDWRPQVAGWARVLPERPEYTVTISSVVQAAFASRGEAEVVESLRAVGALTCSLVAKHDALTGPDAILGHIAFSPVTIDGASVSPSAVGLSPLSVCPNWQNQGIGSALVRAGLHVCRRQGVGLVFVLGSPVYYPRFGFEPGGHYGFTWDKANVGPAFQVIGLTASPADYGDGGIVSYHRAFARLEA